MNVFVFSLLFCRGIRDDLENEDDEESYYRYMEENPLAGVNMDDDELDIEYDEDGNAIIPEHKKVRRIKMDLIVLFH